ncbi:MAG: PAS domain-containing protein, partial [Acidimicrobiales bacterium]
MSPPAFESRKGRSAAFALRALASLPALLMVVDADGVIKDTAGSLGTLVQRGGADLVPSRLFDYVDEEEREVIAELLRVTAASRDSEIVGPSRASYFDAEGARRSLEAWSINRLRDPEIKGICILLLPENAFARFDHILMQIVAGATLEQTFGALVQTLRFPPVSGESFVLAPEVSDRGGMRVPALAEVPGPPETGPWDEMMDTAEPYLHREV